MFPYAVPIPPMRRQNLICFVESIFFSTNHPDVIIDSFRKVAAAGCRL
jgi:hypothetical protein